MFECGNSYIYIIKDYMKKFRIYLWQLSRQQIVGISFILYAFLSTLYMLFIQNTGINYAGIFLIIFFILTGVLNLKAIDQKAYLKNHPKLHIVLWIIVSVLLIYTLILTNTNKQKLTLEEMYQIERSKNQ